MKRCNVIEYEALPKGAVCLGTTYSDDDVDDENVERRVNECPAEVVAVVTEHIDRTETHQGWTTDFYALP